MKYLIFKCKECNFEYELNISSFNPITAFGSVNVLASHIKQHGKELDTQKLLENIGVALGFEVKWK